MRIAQRITGVWPSVAGRNAMPLPRLRAALGARAWRVWEALLTVRGESGTTQASVTDLLDMKGFAPIKHRNAKYGLQRLEQAGLVERVGWRPRTKTEEGKVRTRLVFERRVLGAILLGGEQVAVPDSTVVWVSKASTWGGARAGAGRRAAHPSSPQESSVPCLPIQAFQVCPTPFKCAQPTPQNEESSVPNLLTSNNRKGVNSRMGSSNEEEQRAGARGGSFFSSPELGVGFTGNATGGTPSNAGLPRYPGASVVPPTLVPPPPRLSGIEDDAKRAELLAAAYRGAVASRFGTPCHVLRRGAGRSKWAKLFREAAALLEQWDVSPAAWAAFSCAHWQRVQKHAPGARKAIAVPPINWVFSPKRIVEKLGSETGRVNVEGYAQGGTAVFGSAHKKLLEQWQRMRSAVLAGMPKSEAVERFFPGTHYDDLLGLARAEAQETRFRLEQRAERGEWLWG